MIVGVTTLKIKPIPELKYQENGQYPDPKMVKEPHFLTSLCRIWTTQIGKWVKKAKFDVGFGFNYRLKYENYEI